MIFALCRQQMLQQNFTRWRYPSSGFVDILLFMTTAKVKLKMIGESDRSTLGFGRRPYVGTWGVGGVYSPPRANFLTPSPLKNSEKDAIFYLIRASKMDRD